ncbi:MAG: YHS domain-containing (seleno)protein [Granulosicoccus sp.]
MNWFARSFGICIVAFMSISPIYAAESVNTLDRKGLFGYKPTGVAIRGYDTVAYFTQGKPVEGLGAFSTEWSGATWRFSTQNHLDLFVENPESYAPQYGGYCAYGVSRDYLVKIEPENWTIVNDKLYLNYDSDVQRRWEQDIPGFIKEADSKFEQLLVSED